MNKDFYAESILTKVNYKTNKFDIVKREKTYCKNDIDYIKHFIEFLKDNVIKYLPNINLVNIELGILDRNNTLHCFIIKITNMITKLLNIKLDINKSIIVIVKYNNEIVFNGSVNFTGL